MSDTSNHPGDADRLDYGAKLRSQTLAVRVRHEKFGVRKALSREQVKKAAEEFGANSRLLSAAKRLIDTRDPAYRAVGKVRAQAAGLWKSMTVPYPEPGVRLIRRENVELFDAQMKAIKGQLEEAVAALQAKYVELRDAAKASLGDLFDETDYPERLDEHFDLWWDFPSIDPPAYLKSLNPTLYAQEVDRIRRRFEDAVQLTEAAFVEKFAELVKHLGERLSGQDDGKPKIFRDSAVENLNAFFSEFKSLDIGSNEQLLKLVDTAQNAVKGVTADELRGNLDLRSKVADQLATLTAQIDGMMVNLPKRAIQLDDGEAEGSAAA